MKMELVGRTVKKSFQGFGNFSGVVGSYDPSSGYFKILYEDGDEEELEFGEVAPILEKAGQPSLLEKVQGKKRGRKPKLGHRAEKGSETKAESNSGKSMNTQTGEGGFGGQTLQTLVKDSTSLKGNLMGNVCVGVVGETQMGGSSFAENSKENGPIEDAGLNVDLNGGVSFNGNLKGNANVTIAVVEDTELKNHGSDEIKMKDSGPEVVLMETPEKNSAFDSPDMEEHSRCKRRKLSEKLKSIPERVLRRSARRAAAASLSSTNPVLDSREPEEQNRPPPKPELPPSSNNLNIDGLPILDLFSVYACLRSFSTVLFLSPFGLEAFVTALKCNYSNSLIDSIHFSVLQALKLHLVFLANEGSQSAGDCLRSLNWDFLDYITWPLYLAEYLLIHGSGLKSGFDLCRLKLLDGEYYNQPGFVKLEILRCLCDDVIEVGAIRLELNRRMMMSELDMDADRVVNFESYVKRKDQMEDLGGSCLTREDLDEASDINGDECCLCKMDGSLICCDGCPAAYHSRCIGITKDLLPEGDWYCPECMMDRQDGWMKSSKPLQGAELLGIDPHGRLYFGSCGYLLVSDSCDSEPLYHYYSKNDLIGVIKMLKSADTSYSGIITAISMHWSIPAHSTEVNLYVDSETHDANIPCLPSPQSEQDRVKGVEAKEDSVHAISGLRSSEALESVNQIAEMTSSFGGADDPRMSQVPTCIPVSEKISIKLKTPEKVPYMNEELAVKSTDEDFIQEKHIKSAVQVPLPATNQSKQGTPQLLVEPGSYINYYSLGQMASAVVEELTQRSSDKKKEDHKIAPDEVISAQRQAISKKFTNFSWSGIQKPYVDAQKENCGWCFSCKSPGNRDCLFRLADKKSPEGSKIGPVRFRSKRNRKTHLSSVIYHILSIEYCLRGFLSGPWENPHYSNQWRKRILRASDVSLAKSLLLILESSLRWVALSAEWLKHEDSSVALGSGSLVFSGSVHVSSKHGVGRKRSRKNMSDAAPNFLSSAATVSRIYWWRGGRLSRELFHWKVLPRKLAFKCGRQAGCTKVPGILYPDGLEFPRRSKYVAWEAAVEMSESVAQLAFQVRVLDRNIRWSDLVNTQPSRQLAKESEKLARLFKKVIIRRKCMEGSIAKYLLDFGKRTMIPDVVTKQGVLEESSNDRKKYWLNETFVPLYLLKAYEEKKHARKANKTEFGLLFAEGGQMKKPSRQKGFPYLFSRAEKYEDHRCGHCNKDLVVREAVNCRFCKGFFHKKHARASKGSIFAKHTYACFRCQDKKHVKVEVKTKNQKVHTKSQKVQPGVGKIPEIRRSQRATKNVIYLPVQAKKLNQFKKGSELKSQSDTSKKSKFSSKNQFLKKSRFQSKREMFLSKKSEKETSMISTFQSKRVVSKKSKNDISWSKRQRSSVYHSYWLKGLLWAKKPCDGRRNHFLEKKVLLPAQHSEATFIQPVCRLCHEGYDSRLIYVCCESCEDWFHGDAFGLTEVNNDKLHGFRCPNCLKRRPPVCPHSKDCAVDEFQFHEEESNRMEIEYVRGASADNELLSEMHEKHIAAANEDCSVVDSDEPEPLHRRRRIDAISDSNEPVLHCTEK